MPANGALRSLPRAFRYLLWLIQWETTKTGHRNTGSAPLRRGGRGRQHEWHRPDPNGPARVCRRCGETRADWKRAGETSCEVRS